jgi:hypothetical protein
MKTITITKEQFREAVMKAQDRFESIGTKRKNESDNDADSAKRDMAKFMIGLRNMLFSSMLQNVLFNDESEDNE